MSEEFNIDEIMAKDATERTAAEIEYMITWQVEKRIEEKEWKAAQAEIKKTNAKIVDIARETAEHSRAALDDLVAVALKRYENAE